MNELNIAIGGFFHKTMIKTNNGNISIVSRELQFPISFFQWVGFWKEESIDYEASKIGFCFIEGAADNKLLKLCGRGKKFIAFGQYDCDDHQAQFILSPNDANAIKDYIETFNPLYKHADSFIYEQAIQLPLRRKEIIWANNQYVVYTRRGSGRTNIAVQFSPIAQTLFYNVHEGKVASSKFLRWIYQKLKLTGCIYFGGVEQIVMAYPGKDFNQKLNQYLLTNGAPIKMENMNEVYESKFRFANIFHPSNWHTKERIGFSEHAVIYEKTTRRGKDILFLPFDYCYVVMHTSGFVNQRPAIYGLMNILPVQTFDKNIVNKFIEGAKAHGLDANANGMVIRSTYMWFNWISLILTFGLLRNARIVEGERIFLFVKGRRGKISSGASHSSRLSGSLSGRKQILPKPCTTGIYQRERWFNLYGRLLVTSSTSSIRADQSKSAGAVVELEKVWYFKAKKWTNRLGWEREILKGMFSGK